MAWRFRKSFKIAPGVRLNVSKKGLGVSAGVKGARVGIGPGGRTYTSTSIPGLGLYSINYSNGSRSRAASSTSPAGVGCLLAVVLVAFVYLGMQSQWIAWGIPIGAAVGVCFLYNTNAQRAKRCLSRARFEIERGEYETALAKLEESTRLVPSDETEMLRGSLLNDLKRFPEVKEVFSKLHERDPSNELAAVLLAHALYKTGEFEKAIPIAQSVPETSSWRLKSISLVGACFADLGKHELAIEALKTAPLQKRTLDDDLKEIHYNLAESYLALGNKKKAEQHYSRVLSQDAGFLDVAKKLEELEG